MSRRNCWSVYVFLLLNGKVEEEEKKRRRLNALVTRSEEKKHAKAQVFSLSVASLFSFHIIMIINANGRTNGRPVLSDGLENVRYYVAISP